MNHCELFFLSHTCFWMPSPGQTACMFCSFCSLLASLCFFFFGFCCSCCCCCCCCCILWSCSWTLDGACMVTIFWIWCACICPPVCWIWIGSCSLICWGTVPPCCWACAWIWAWIWAATWGGRADSSWTGCWRPGTVMS